MGKFVVSAEPEDPSVPIYSHLQPIVERLLSSGNTPSRSELWGSTREGYVCYLEHPINFALVRACFELPESIVLSEEKDLIACSKTWATIYGSIAPRGA
jgi:hypothetical protein